MARSLRVMMIALVLVFLVAPSSLHAQRGGATRGGSTGMASRPGGVRNGPGLVGRPVTPFVNPPVSSFSRPNQFPAFKPSRPFVRSPRSVVVTPGLGFGGFGYGYYSPYYPYYGDPFYPYSYPYSPYPDYSYPQPSYAAPQVTDDSGAGQNEALSYEVGRLSQEVESLRQQQAAQAVAPRPVPQPGPVTPVVLVFRDGHRMEIQNYAIIGQTLWVLDETNSSKIPLSDLDLDTTQQENRARGLRFSLPSR